MEVKTNASSNEIVLAYESLIQNLEKKRNIIGLDETQIQKKAIVMAYEILSNQASRDAYDAKLFAIKSTPENAQKIEVNVAINENGRSPLRRVLAVIAGVMVICLAMQLIYGFIVYRANNGQIATVNQHDEKMKIRQYYQEYGVWLKSGDRISPVPCVSALVILAFICILDTIKATACSRFVDDARRAVKPVSLVELKRFSDLLAHDLGPRVQVVNAAVPGYGTDQQLWTLQARGQALAPDLIVLVFLLNDILECDRSVSYDMHKPRFVLEGDSWSIEGLPVADPRSSLRRWLGPLPADLCSHSGLWSWLDRLRHGATPTAELEPRARPYNVQFAEQVREVSERMLKPNSTARHALSEMRAWCAKRSIPFGVVVLPHKHDQYLYEPSSGRPDFDGTTSLTKALLRVGSELDFPVFNIDALMFEATGKGESLHCGDGHFNAAGNRLLADALKPQLEAWLVPR